MTQIATRPRATLVPFVLGLALLTGGCAGNSSSSPLPDSSDLYDNYDSNNDDALNQDEWDRAFEGMDANGDGLVTGDEFNAALGRSAR